MFEGFRSGLWLTRERARLVCAILLVFYGLSIGFLFATSNGRLDRFDRPLGTDFSGVWTAGVEALEGQPAMAFDPQAHAAKQRTLFGDPDGFFPWSYPPYFLALATGLALLPYALSLLVWQGASFALYFAASRRIVSGPDVWLAVAAFPAVFVNFGHGQNGFLTAALFGGGLLLLDRRPWLAGVLFGLLAYKPQFGLLLPLALLAGRHGRAIAGAALTLFVTTIASIEAFGWTSWQAFFDCLDYSRRVNVEAGVTGWEKIQTVFAAARMWGAPVEVAYVVQGASTLACAAVLILLWGARADWRLRGAALLTASMLSTPYALDYDMMLLGPAIAMMASYGMERGFCPYEKSALGIVWMAPLMARSIAMVSLLPVGVLSMLFLFGVVAWRGLVDMGAVRFVSELLAKHQRLVAQMRAFLVVGIVGFVVDASVTTTLAGPFGLSPYAARAPGVMASILTTWALNRKHTFRSRSSDWAMELVRYMSVCFVGTAVNYGVYTGVLMAVESLGLTFLPRSAAIVLAVGCGSLTSMTLTFTGFRLFAFHQVRARKAA